MICFTILLGSSVKMERYKLNCILVARYNICIVTDLKRQRKDLWMCRWFLLKYAEDLLALSGLMTRSVIMIIIISKDNSYTFIYTTACFIYIYS